VPFKYTWPIVAFFTANIVIATMFLRWHYVIDVLAGMLLATIAHLLSAHAAEREPQRRQAHGLMPLWPEWP
jgi:membrane-associated phospholipid phosphatase